LPVPSSPPPGTPLGLRLRTAREQRGLSQRELGDGIASASYVSLIESGAREPSSRLLEALAQRLQTTSGFLRTGRSDGDHAALELQVRKVEAQLATGEAHDALAQLRDMIDQAPAAQRLELIALRARALENVGSHREAIHDLEELASECAAGGPSSLTLAISLTRNYRELGELTYAIEIGERSLQDAERHELQGSPHFAHLVATVAAAYMERGDVTRAEWLLNKALSQLVSDDPAARGALLWNLALTAERRGDVALARELIGQAQLQFSGWSDERNRARLQVAVAGLALRSALPDLRQAEEQLRLARETLIACGSKTDLAYCASEQARWALLSGDPHGAISSAREALHQLSEDALETGRALAVIAHAWSALGDDKAAHESLRLAAESLESAQAGRQAALLWRELADLTQELGNAELANRYLSHALDSAGVGTAVRTPTRPQAEHGAPPGSRLATP
jgi:transcriptional regulator with XRE-family HTH domain